MPGLAVATKVTVIGGGTGSFNVLSGLRHHAHLAIRSIVTMMDSGGDSGRLRDEFGVLPPGDVRRCLVALSEESALLRNLFSFRFDEDPLSGRSFGNLFFLALTRTLGSEQHAVEAIGRILKIRGRVIPVTWDHAHLVAELEDGSQVEGEANLDVPRHDTNVPICRVRLEPRARANPEALAALQESDFVVLAPGDLYGSTIPNLLVEGIAEALQASRARLVYAVNLMTRAGQTLGFRASRHVEEVARYAGRTPDAVLVQAGEIPAGLARRYEAEAAHPVEVDVAAIEALGVGLVHAEDVMCAASFVRHDPVRTARALVWLFDALGTAEPEVRGVPHG
jgi:uncharacterized cofD-like protein